MVLKGCPWDGQGVPTDYPGSAQCSQTGCQGHRNGRFWDPTVPQGGPKVPPRHPPSSKVQILSNKVSKWMAETCFVPPVLVISRCVTAVAYDKYMIHICYIDIIRNVIHSSYSYYEYILHTYIMNTSMMYTHASVRMLCCSNLLVHAKTYLHYCWTRDVIRANSNTHTV